MTEPAYEVEIIPAGAPLGRSLTERSRTTTREDVKVGWLAAQDRPNTVAAYVRDIDAYFAWCDENDLDVLAMRRLDVDRYRLHLLSGAAGHDYKATSVHRKLSVLASYYRHALQNFDGAVASNPLANVKRPKVANESTTSSLDLEELQAVLRRADASSLSDSALIRMLAFTGARVTELCTARTADLRMDRGCRVIDVTRKGGKRITLAIPAEADEALQRHLGGRRGLLFIGQRGRPMNRSVVTYRLSLLVEQAGITGKRVTPHSLRHTAATLALDAGADIRDVQRMLGHDRIETTLRYDRSRMTVDRSPAHLLARTVMAGIQDEGVERGDQ